MQKSEAAEDVYSKLDYFQRSSDSSTSSTVISTGCSLTSEDCSELTQFSCNPAYYSVSLQPASTTRPDNNTEHTYCKLDHFTATQLPPNSTSVTAAVPSCLPSTENGPMFQCPAVPPRPGPVAMATQTAAEPTHLSANHSYCHVKPLSADNTPHICEVV